MDIQSIHLGQQQLALGSFAFSNDGIDDTHGWLKHRTTRMYAVRGS